MIHVLCVLSLLCRLLVLGSPTTAFVLDFSAGKNHDHHRDSRWIAFERCTKNKCSSPRNNLGGRSARRSKHHVRWFSMSASDDNSNNNDPNLLLNYSELNNDYYALRHGQSLANVAGLIASNPTIACGKYGLSQPTGFEQATLAGDDVVKRYSGSETRAHPYDGILILTSDLLRAKQTAGCVRDAIVGAQKEQDGASEDPLVLHLYNNDVVEEPRLRERWFGEWDMTSDANYEKVWLDDAVSPDHTIHGVESVNAVIERTTACILDWDKRVQSHMVICVAHGDVLQILQTAFSKMDGSLHRSLPHLETAQLRPLLLSNKLQ